MLVLITGGFGNVGHAIIHELLQRSHEVRVLELKNKKTLKHAKKYGKQIEVYWGNLLDKSSIKASLENIDVVLHLAGIIPPLSETNKELCQKVNVGGTENLLDEIRLSIRKPPIIFTSSATIMGPTQNQEPPIDPYASLNPKSNYTQSKVDAEEALQKSDLSFCICRFSAVLTTFILGTLNAMTEAFEMPLDNRVEMVLDLDLAVALVNAAELMVKGNTLNGKILNIGGGKDFQRYARNLTQDIFEIMGIGKLDEKCYTREDYYLDWLDTEESQALLQFQNHSYEEAIKIFVRPYRKLKTLIRLVSPIIRNIFENKSPYRET
ncbi:NAD(P)-dependent oxidoreductase [Candidatus Heimdallarchaeota archaeon]|nr:MAG: NAD(P)-dependent oxidoreductase [Candidatus Heimdallarchaeota archaeon]